ncbi:MAG: hypothetical protein PHO01_11675 [Desulfotomaculaceae bacterium]|nr:hypothetical protein [Desulfotomaculaceae bacterium]
MKEKWWSLIAVFGLMLVFASYPTIPANGESEALSNLSEQITNQKILGDKPPASPSQGAPGQELQPDSPYVSALTGVGSRKMVLIDFPGVSWKGEHREGDWGTLLPKDHVTIYVRHQGAILNPGGRDWISRGVKVIELPHQWDEKAAEAKLRPEIEAALKAGKSVHVIGDLNITFLRHVIRGKSGEDMWGATLADYTLKTVAQISPGTFNIFAAHSHGTIVTNYMKETGKIHYGILASPRGDQGVSLALTRPNLPLDIIRAKGDAPSWQRKVNIDSLRYHSNTRILELQDSKAGRIATHGMTDNLDTKGKFQVRGRGYEKEVLTALREPIADRLELAMRRTYELTYLDVNGKILEQDKIFNTAKAMTSMASKDTHGILIITDSKKVANVAGKGIPPNIKNKVIHPDDLSKFLKTPESRNYDTICKFNKTRPPDLEHVYGDPNVGLRRGDSGFDGPPPKQPPMLPSVPPPRAAFRPLPSQCPLPKIYRNLGIHSCQKNVNLPSQTTLRNINCPPINIYNPIYMPRVYLPTTTLPYRPLPKLP